MAGTRQRIAALRAELGKALPGSPAARLLHESIADLERSAAIERVEMNGRVARAQLAGTPYDEDGPSVRQQVASLERAADLSRRAIRAPALGLRRQRRGGCGRPRARRTASATRSSRGSPDGDDGGSGDPEPPGLALPRAGRQKTAGARTGE
jgi:hypothetical protein